MSSNYNRDADNLYAPTWVSHDQDPTLLFNEIVPGLFQGGTPDEDWDRAGGLAGTPRSLGRDGGLEGRFDAVVTLFAWAQPCDWGVEELRYGFYDAHPRLADMSRVVRVARWAYERWSDGDQVLIRCQAGLNRSGLITALVLMLAGWTPQAAISQMRRERAEVALVNDDFVDWLVEDAVDILAQGRPSPSTSPSESVAA